jgi:hypothetical protein
MPSSLCHFSVYCGPFGLDGDIELCASPSNLITAATVIGELSMHIIFILLDFSLLTLPVYFLFTVSSTHGTLFFLIFELWVCSRA